MHLLSSTTELKTRKRLSIMLCTLDHNHIWHRYSLCTSSYAIAPKHVLRSQCSVKHTALVLTLRLRTRQAMEPGAGTKGDPNPGSFSRDHWRTTQTSMAPAWGWHTGQRSISHSQKKSKHHPSFSFTNTYFLHCLSQRIGTGNTFYIIHYCYCCCCCC